MASKELAILNDDMWAASCGFVFPFFFRIWINALNGRNLLE